MNSQWRLIGLGVILLLIGVGARAIEEPAYTVVDQWQDGDIEIRSYEPRVWAVTSDGSESESGIPSVSWLYLWWQQAGRRDRDDRACQKFDVRRRRQRDGFYDAGRLRHGRSARSAR